MANVNVQGKNYQKKWDFDGTALPADWSIVQLGAGMSVSVANSLLSITTGTTASSNTIIRCQKAFNTKAVARFIARLSQRIVNQTFSLEMVNANGDTAAGWKLYNATATTGYVYSMNGSVANADVSVAIPTTANFDVFEIMADAEQCVFSSTASNTASSTKTAYSLLDRLIPEPDEDYYLQIRVTNGGTAPASTTTFDIDSAFLEDLTMVGVEILRASGDAIPAMAMPIRATGGTVDTVSNVATCATVTTVTTANILPKILQYTDSVAVLAAAGTFTGTARDIGTAVASFSKFRGMAYADQAGTLYVEQSADKVTWTVADTFALTAGSTVKFDENVICRYVRVRYLNGATLQGAFRLYSTLVAN